MNHFVSTKNPWKKIKVGKIGKGIFLGSLKESLPRQIPRPPAGAVGIIQKYITL
jgi:hypothetical protein